MGSLPEPTRDLTLAKRDMDEFGYCLLEGALAQTEVEALRARLFEQLAAETERGVGRVLPDRKQLVVFLLNKGQVFRDMILNASLHAIVRHVLGEQYLLSSYHAHFAHPGSKTAFHTDQFWMPPPTNASKQTLVKPGSVTRSGNRGHHVGGDELIAPATISPAVVCNAMWMLDDFTEENGATLVVPGSHLSGRQPDHDLDAKANWTPALGKAGTAVVFEGRTWHSTGENRTSAPRIGLTTNFCAPQFRQQENYLMGT
ncbi:MAG: phytanoyl-CoA dioxygenase family protein, partial [Gammaproteobacteria bacterium]|nr:phytanoyl-CoA dioxygenase family protein [Gammaproteobacteria bacterium]